VYWAGVMGGLGWWHGGAVALVAAAGVAMWADRVRDRAPVFWGLGLIAAAAAVGVLWSLPKVKPEMVGLAATFLSGGGLWYALTRRLADPWAGIAAWPALERRTLAAACWVPLALTPLVFLWFVAR
jgi:hypothetical protein